LLKTTVKKNILKVHREETSVNIQGKKDKKMTASFWMANKANSETNSLKSEREEQSI
jgi:hypothetical protein